MRLPNSKPRRVNTGLAHPPWREARARPPTSIIHSETPWPIPRCYDNGLGALAFPGDAEVGRRAGRG